MGTIGDAQPVKLFVGMLAARPQRLADAERRLVGEFGSVDLSSPVLPFEQTEYYREQMGPDLKRKFLGFERLIRPEALVEAKRITNNLEKDLASDVDAGPVRPVNLDPGYLAFAKVVLATTKDFSHRVYLGGGIYAEVTLRYRRGRYEPWEWTYPDYRTPEYGAFFLEMRERLRQQLRTVGR